MDLLNLFINILDAHTRRPDFRPYLGQVQEVEPVETTRPQTVKRSVFVQKPEPVSGEKFKRQILSNPRNQELLIPPSTETERLTEVQNFPRKKIVQAS